MQKLIVNKVKIKHNFLKQNTFFQLKPLLKQYFIFVNICSAKKTQSISLFSKT